MAPTALKVEFRMALACDWGLPPQLDGGDFFLCHQEFNPGDFPGGALLETPHIHCTACGFHLWLGN